MENSILLTMQFSRVNKGSVPWSSRQRPRVSREGGSTESETPAFLCNPNQSSHGTHILNPTGQDGGKRPHCHAVHKIMIRQRTGEEEGEGERDWDFIYMFTKESHCLVFGFGFSSRKESFASIPLQPYSRHVPYAHSRQIDGTKPNSDRKSVV